MNIDTNDAPVTVEPAAELAEMLLVGTETGAFDHTPEEIGLHVMENAQAILNALASAPAGDGRMLPCPNPWCDSDGSPFMHRVVSHREEWAVSCGCGFLGPILDSPERAEVAWNSRRAAVAPAGDGVEKEAASFLFHAGVHENTDRAIGLIPYPIALRAVREALARPRASLEGQPA